MSSLLSKVIKKLTPEEVPLGDDKMIIKVKRLDSRYTKRGHIEIVDAGAAPTKIPDHDIYASYVLQFTRYYNQFGMLTRRTLEIKSTLLKKVLKEIIEDYPGISFQTASVTLDYPLRVLWFFRDELRVARDLEKRSEKGRHIGLLVDFLDKEFTQLDRDYNNLIEEGLMDFNMMWTLFKPKELIYTTFHGQDRVLETKSYKERQIEGGTYGVIESNCIDYNGEIFGFDSTALVNPYFEGAKKITDLPVYPLKFHSQEKALRARLVARGHKFAALQGMHCMEYSGPTISEKGHWGSKLYVNGRIMVDVATHTLFHPEKTVVLESLLSDRTRKEEAPPQVDSMHAMYYDEMGRPSHNPYAIPATPLTKAEIAQDKDKKVRKIIELTDDQALLCAPAIYGFALVEKQWVKFFVENIAPVQWNPLSFDQLVLPDQQKQLVRALVQSHTSTSTKFDDFIVGKGQGLIACLHGPPGCGKTMTAESVAEFTKSPLYNISAGDLGADPQEMEKSLSRILRLCTQWNAVLLLDEADVFLEERSLHDLGRNALVSIFLRLLEYYSGILFLTTNRVKTFDEAFQSRIHVALRYRNLDEAAREQVWRNFIKKIESGHHSVVTDIRERDYEFLGSVVLNGRQIKNAARTAMSLAENENKTLSVDFIKNVLGVVEAFEKDFLESKGGK